MFGTFWKYVENHEYVGHIMFFCRILNMLECSGESWTCCINILKTFGQPLKNGESWNIWIILKMLGKSCKCAKVWTCWENPETVREIMKMFGKSWTRSENPEHVGNILKMLGQSWTHCGKIWNVRMNLDMLGEILKMCGRSWKMLGTSWTCWENPENVRNNTWNC